MLKTILLAAAATGLAGASIPANATANETEIQPSMRVGYGDLNLLTKDGQAEFDRRIARAVRKVCRSGGSIRGVGDRLASRACMKATSQSVAPQKLAVLEAARGNRVAVLAKSLAVIAVR
ncbi:MAG: UrcA family protein [Pseudomonadota bacterium]